MTISCLVLLLSAVLVVTQKYPKFFENGDFKINVPRQNAYYGQVGTPSPMRETPTNNRNTHPNFDYDLVSKISQKYLPDPSDDKDINLDQIYDFEEKLTKTNKWEEFFAKLAEEQQTKKNSAKEWRESFSKYNEWLDDVLEEKKENSEHTNKEEEFVSEIDPRGPTAGMEGYWPSKPKQEKINTPTAGIPNLQKMIPTEQLLQMAKNRAKAMENGAYYPPLLKQPAKIGSTEGQHVPGTVTGQQYNMAPGPAISPGLVQQHSMQSGPGMGPGFMMGPQRMPGQHVTGTGTGQQYNYNMAPGPAMIPGLVQQHSMQSGPGMGPGFMMAPQRMPGQHLPGTGTGQQHNYNMAPGPAMSPGLVQQHNNMQSGPVMGPGFMMGPQQMPDNLGLPFLDGQPQAGEPPMPSMSQMVDMLKQTYPSGSMPAGPLVNQPPPQESFGPRPSETEMMHNVPPFAQGSVGEQYWRKKLAQKTDAKWPSKAADIPESGMPRFMAQHAPQEDTRDLRTKPQPAASVALGPPADAEWQSKAISALPSKKYSLPAIFSEGENQLDNDLQSLPNVDDFGSPIRWVKFNSNATEDGLAKVTDLRTGKNRQALVKGTIYVPVTDYNLERLGIKTKQTNVPKPKIPAQEQAIFKTLNKNVDMKKINEKDWLAIEVAIGGNPGVMECDGDGCQSRCDRMACETSCSGDTCAAGCIGDSCTALCKGPGCKAMCIGVDCNAVCDGMSCDTRCHGQSCEAKCRKFSCQQTTNGVFKGSEATWEESYPQYG